MCHNQAPDGFGAGGFEGLSSGVEGRTRGGYVINEENYFTGDWFGLSDGKDIFHVG